MKKYYFLINWSLLTLAFLTLGYLLGYIGGLFTGSLFGLTVADDGTHLAQTAVYCVFGSIVITSLTITQLTVLKRYNIKISKWWILAGILGIVASEILCGTLLWQLNINRSDLGIFQGGPQLPEALIFSFSGLLIGIFQWMVIRKKIANSIYWIPVSFLGWGLGHLIMINILAFFIGGFLLGIITGLFFLVELTSAKPAIH